MKRATVTSRNPWAIIPTLYFAEGLPYIIINTVSVILYKRMGIDNPRIAMWTSVLYLPWVIKMLWGPLVDMYATKRSWILSTQLVMGACMLLAAFTLTMEGFFFFSLAAFAAAAFVSATYDIATDGFYMLALTNEDQALFVGLRAGFYRLAMIFGSGFLVYLAGQLQASSGDVASSWMKILIFAALIFLLLFLYHWFALPFPTTDGRRGGNNPSGAASFLEIITSYFKRKKILVILAFILLYRLGEAMLVKLVSPFLLDARQAGGVGLSPSEVGPVYGTVGILS